MGFLLFKKIILIGCETSFEMNQSGNFPIVPHKRNGNACINLWFCSSVKVGHFHYNDMVSFAPLSLCASNYVACEWKLLPVGSKVVW